MRNINLGPEITFRTMREKSKGKPAIVGSSEVELLFHIDASKLLSVKEKSILKRKLKNRITVNGFLYISSQSATSLDANKEKAIEQFYGLLSESLNTESVFAA
ncbi:MAG: hypothetical protein AAF502_02110 [Bacteroidota bacterium]